MNTKILITTLIAIILALIFYIAFVMQTTNEDGNTNTAPIENINGVKNPNAKCVVGGCSGQLCVAEGENAASTCEWRQEYACYDSAVCERQSNGACGWTQTDALLNCIEDARKSP